LFLWMTERDENPGVWRPFPDKLFHPQTPDAPIEKVLPAIPGNPLRRRFSRMSF